MSMFESKIDRSESAKNAATTMAMQLLKMIIDDLGTDNFTIEEIQEFNDHLKRKSDAAGRLHHYGIGHIKILTDLELLEVVSINEVWRVSDRAMAILSEVDTGLENFPGLNRVMTQSEILHLIS